MNETFIKSIVVGLTTILVSIVLGAAVDIMSQLSIIPEEFTVNVVSLVNDYRRPDKLNSMRIVTAPELYKETELRVAKFRVFNVKAEDLSDSDLRDVNDSNTKLIYDSSVKYSDSTKRIVKGNIDLLGKYASCRFVCATIEEEDPANESNKIYIVRCTLTNLTGINED